MNDARTLLTSLHQAALRGAAPFAVTQSAVGRWLQQQRQMQTDVSRKAHIIALGKASAAMAAGAVQALREYDWLLAGGVVVSASRTESSALIEQGGALPENIVQRIGDHPVPDIGSLAAADAVARAVQYVATGDIAIVLISGGATSLCAAPCAEFSAAVGHPADAQRMLASLVQALHERGLAIHEMNAVRRRVLRWGAGRLAVALAERGVAAIPVFAISDVIGDDPAVIGSGPCTADPLSQPELLALFDAHSLRSALPRELGVALGLQGFAEDSVVSPATNHAAFSKVTYEIVANNRDALRAIEHSAYTFGLERVTIADTPLVGEAATLGHELAAIALGIAQIDEREQLLVWGGEPTVRLDISHRALDESDEEDVLQHEDVLASDAIMRATSGLYIANDATPLGGRMQVLALAASLALEQAAEQDNTEMASRITILAAGTDGRDGPTDACGAIVNCDTPWHVRERVRNPVRDLDRLQSHYALNAAGALLRTGPTGTNVMDIVAVHIAARETPAHIPAS